MVEHMGFDKRAVQQLFDGAAQLSGTVGTRQEPGVLTITVAGRQLGAGPTFAEALLQAQRQAADLTRGVHP